MPKLKQMFGVSFKGLTRYYETLEEAERMAMFCGVSKNAVFVAEFV